MLKDDSSVNGSLTFSPFTHQAKKKVQFFLKDFLFLLYNYRNGGERIWKRQRREKEIIHMVDQRRLNTERNCIVIAGLKMH